MRLNCRRICGDGIIGIARGVKILANFIFLEIRIEIVIGRHQIQRGQTRAGINPQHRVHLDPKKVIHAANGVYFHLAAVRREPLEPNGVLRRLAGNGRRALIRNNAGVVKGDRPIIAGQYLGSGKVGLSRCHLRRQNGQQEDTTNPHEVSQPHAGELLHNFNKIFHLFVNEVSKTRHGSRSVQQD